MNGICSTHAELWSGILKGKDLFGDLDIDGRIILKLIQEKKDVRGWSGLGLHRTGSNGRSFWIQYWTYRFHGNRKFLGQLINCQLSYEYPAPCSQLLHSVSLKDLRQPFLRTEYLYDFANDFEKKPATLLKWVSVCTYRTHLPKRLASVSIATVAYELLCLIVQM